MNFLRKKKKDGLKTVIPEIVHFSEKFQIFNKHIALKDEVIFRCIFKSNDLRYTSFAAV